MDDNDSEMDGSRPVSHSHDPHLEQAHDLIVQAGEDLRRGDVAGALALYGRSLQELNTAIESQPEARSFALKAETLKGLAELHKRVGFTKLFNTLHPPGGESEPVPATIRLEDVAGREERDRATRCYEQAAAAFLEAAVLEPQNSNHRLGHARVLTSLSVLLSIIGSSKVDALRRAEEAMTSLEEAIQWAPEEPKLKLERASLKMLAASLSSWIPSQSYLEQAVDELTQLRTSSLTADALTQETGATIELATLKARMGRFDDALTSFTRAIKQLTSNTDHSSVNSLRLGDVCVRMAKTYEQLGLRRAALNSLDKASEAFKSALLVRPEDHFVQRERASCLRYRGDVLVGLLDTQTALASYEEALRAYDQLAAAGINDSGLSFLKGETLFRMGELEYAEGQPEDAAVRLKAAREMILSVSVAPSGAKAKTLLLDEIRKVLAACQPKGK